MWDQLVNTIKDQGPNQSQISQPKNSGNSTHKGSFQDIVVQDITIDISSIWKYNTNELGEFVIKLDKNNALLKKKSSLYEQQSIKLRIKVESLENERKRLTEERDLCNKTMQELQIHLNGELVTNLRLKQAQEKSNIQIELLRKQLKDMLSENLQNGNGKDPNDNILYLLKKQDQEELKTIMEQIQQDTELLTERIEQERKLKEKVQNQQKGSADAKEEESDEQFTVQQLIKNLTQSFEVFNEQSVTLINQLKSRSKEGITSVSDDQNKKLSQLMISDLEKQIKDLKNEIDFEKQALETEQQKFKQLQNSKLEVDQQNQSLNQALKNEKEKSNALDTQIREANSNISSISDDKQMFESEIQKVVQEQNMLKSQLLNVHEELQKEKKKMQEERIKFEEDKTILNQENDELNNDIQAMQKEIDIMEQKMKENNEICLNKIKEADNRLYQEKIKVDQKTKDFTQLEQKLNEAKADLLAQIEINEQNKNQIQVLEEQRLLEKAQIKEQKAQILDYANQSRQKEIEISNQRLSFDRRIKEKEKEFEVYREKVNSQQEIKRNILEQDIKINNLEILVGELQSQQEDQQAEFEKLIIKQKQVESQYQKAHQMLQTLQSQRETALIQIQKLSSQNDQLQSIIKNQTQTGALNPSDFVNFDQLMLQPPSHPGGGQNSINSNESSTSSAYQTPGSVQTQKNDNMQFSEKQIAAIQAENDPPLSVRSQSKYLKCVMLVQKEMDVLNQDYLDVAFPIDQKNHDPQKALINFQKRIMDTIKQSQDLIDALEDMPE